MVLALLLPGTGGLQIPQNPNAVQRKLGNA